MSMDDFVGSLTEEQRQELLKALSGDKSEEKEEIVPAKKEKVNEVFVDEHFRVHRPEEENSRTTVRGRGSESDFIDPGGGRGEETEMPEIVKKIPPVSRGGRKPPVKVEYTCGACGDKFKENPELVYGEYHRCDRCKRRSR